MNMENSQTQLTCPTPEELGAFLLDNDDVQMAEHVRGCAKCQQVLDEFRQVDAVTTQCFRPLPGLAGRIQSACQREAERMEADRVCQELSGMTVPTVRRFRWQPVLAMAASLVVVAVVSALTTATFLRQPAVSTQVATEALQPQRLVAPPAPVYLAAAPAVPRQPVQPQQIAAESHEGFSLADSRRLQLDRRAHDDAVAEVAMVSSEGRRLSANNSIRQLTLLPDEIEQVWIASDELSAQEFVQQTRKEHPEILEEASEPDEEGITTLRLNASDVAVQELVDILYQHGKWSLLSANYPQPAQGNEVAFQDRPMKYTLKILSK